MSSNLAHSSMDLNCVMTTVFIFCSISAFVIPVPKISTLLQNKNTIVQLKNIQKCFSRSSPWIEKFLVVSRVQIKLVVIYRAPLRDTFFNGAVDDVIKTGNPNRYIDFKIEAQLSIIFAGRQHNPGLLPGLCGPVWSSLLQGIIQSPDCFPMNKNPL